MWYFVFHWFFDALDRFWRAANWVPNLYDICMLYCMRWRSPCFWRARHEIEGNLYQMFNAYRLSTSHVVEGSAARISCASRTDRTNTGSTLFGTRTVATEIWIQWHYIHVWIWNSIYVHVCLFVMLVHVLQILNLLFCITSMHIVHPVLCAPKFLYMLRLADSGSFAGHLSSIWTAQQCNMWLCCHGCSLEERTAPKMPWKFVWNTIIKWILVGASSCTGSLKGDLETKAYLCRKVTSTCARVALHLECFQCSVCLTLHI